MLLRINFWFGFLCVHITDYKLIGLTQKDLEYFVENLSLTRLL